MSAFPRKVLSSITRDHEFFIDPDHGSLERGPMSPTFEGTLPKRPGAALARHRLIDPAGGDHRIPRLEDLLAAVPATTPVVLELKDPRFAEPARLERLLAILGTRAESHRAAVIAFDARLLAAVRAGAPGLVTGHISTRDPFGDPSCDLLGPWWPLLYANPWYVRRAHARGQRVCPLDPHLHRHLPRWLAMGVDAVLTNDPRATRAEIERLRAGG